MSFRDIYNFYYENIDIGGNSMLKERKIIYIHTIGSVADKFAKEHFSSWVLFNPRIKVGSFGNFKAKKYSFMTLGMNDFYSTALKIEADCKYPSPVMMLKENDRNIWLVERTTFH